MDLQIASGFCLGCEAELNTVACIDGAPVPGATDALICRYCGYVMIFDKACKIRNPTIAECHALINDPRLMVSLRATVCIKAVKS